MSHVWKNLTANVPLYIYDPGSVTSNFIGGDSDFQESIRNYIANPTGIGYGKINDQYTGSGVQTLMFPNQTVHTGAGWFDKFLTVGTGQFDAIGEIQFDAEPASENGINGYSVINITVDMEAEDLFDFNYFNSIPYGPQAAASCQKKS